jgi:hypothetical protein
MYSLQAGSTGFFRISFFFLTSRLPAIASQSGEAGGEGSK